MPTFTDFFLTLPTVNRKFLITDFRLLLTSVKRENFIDFYRRQKSERPPVLTFLSPGLLLPPGTFSSQLDPCPAYDIFCLGVVEDFVGEDPDVGGPLHRKVLGVAYRPAVDPAQVLPICQLAARVLMVSDLRMACLLSH